MLYIIIRDHVGFAGGPFVMLLGRDYAMAASFCLRIALLILPVLHSTMWCTRFLRDFAKVSNSKYRRVVIMRGVLATVCVCQVCFLSRLTVDWWRVGVYIRHVLTSVLLLGVVSRLSSCCFMISTESRGAWLGSGLPRSRLPSGSRWCQLMIYEVKGDSCST